MRLVKCVPVGAVFTVIGSLTSVVIVGPKGQPGDHDFHPGWQGDLDQVVSEHPDGTPLTLADALGERVCHFEDLEVERPAPRQRAKPSTEAPQSALEG